MLSIHKQNLENVITPFHSSFVAPGLKKNKKNPNQNSTSWAKYAYKNLQTKTEIVETAMLQPLSHLKQTKKGNLIIRVVTVEVKSKAFSAQMSFTLVEFCQDDHPSLVTDITPALNIEIAACSELLCLIFPSLAVS